MLPDDHPDRIQIAFDDHRLVNNAGLILPATLALHLGLPQLVDRHLDLGDAPGRAHPGRQGDDAGDVCAVSRAAVNRTTGVSKFRITVRPIVQQKFHLSGP